MLLSGPDVKPSIKTKNKSQKMKYWYYFKKF